VGPRLECGRLSRAPGASAIGAVSIAALALAGCGGGTVQSHGEPAASFTMKVLRASFPAKQSIAKPTQFEVQVKNTGAHTVPNVAVTVDSFNYTSNYPGLAANKRPAWAIERGPGPVANPPVNTQEVSQSNGGGTVYLNTWALGKLAPGKTQTFIWHVIPLKPGVHTVHYTVAAGLAGKAKAALASGGAVQGEFTVNVAAAPAATHVNPNTGLVVPGAAPPPSSP
jgi:hypothetical protein